MDRISIGIVGLGAIAKNMHVPVLSTFEDVNIKAAEVDVVDVERCRLYRQG